MHTETERKEDKAMVNANDARRAHDLLDELDARAELSQEQEKLLRSFLPEKPKQMTLEEITDDVYKAWIASSGDEWVRDGITGSVISLEDWLTELHTQLKGLKDTHTAVPALPAGMRLAKHEEYGRCVVSPGRNHFGQCMIFALDSDREAGSDWHYEPSTSLTFLDTSPTARAHPEFLETEADYQNAPEGTIVAWEDSLPWHKFDSEWLSTAAYEGNNAKNMTGIIRSVLRWGNQ